MAEWLLRQFGRLVPFGSVGSIPTLSGKTEKFFLREGKRKKKKTRNKKEQKKQKKICSFFFIEKQFPVCFIFEKKEPKRE